MSVRPAPAGSFSRAGYGVLGTVTAIALWQLLSVSGILAASVVPSASDVFTTGVDYLADPAVLSAAGQTLRTWVIGILVTVAVAVPLGLAVGVSPFFSALFMPIFEFLKPIPPVALIPLTLLLWGPSQTMKVTLVLIGALWPLFTQVMYGVRAVDQVSIDMARVYRLSRWQLTFEIYLKALLPSMLTGLRIAAAIALIVSIVAEYIGGAAGLGSLIAVQQVAGNLPEMYALIVLCGCLGLVVNLLFGLAETPLLRHHPARGQEVTA